MSEYKNLVKFDERGYPKCEKHGAMNCVSVDKILWRCSICHIGVAFDSYGAFTRWLASFIIEVEGR